jgi:tetratricopeptide (TPR) repeat protein
MSRLLTSRPFRDIDEMNAFLQQTLASGELGRLIAELPADPKEQAQDLAYRALQAGSGAQARRLAQQALQLDPDCVDALVALMDSESLTTDQYCARLRAAVQAGERSLGADFFRENKGHFWGQVQTRPYMRARFQLATLFVELGRNEEAIREFEGILELNPGDNQGVREPLLGLYLLTDRLDAADRLFRQYRGDASASFAWGRVLREWVGGNTVRATRALEGAMECNSHVADYMTGRRKMTAAMPDYYALGSKEEAAHCILGQGCAWLAHPAALDWLGAMCAR